MTILWFAGVVAAYHFEQRGTPMLASAGIAMNATASGSAIGTQPGGNMEGKETRFGIANSALFATVTTDASCGAVNSMHDSFTPARRTRSALQYSSWAKSSSAASAPDSTAC